MRASVYVYGGVGVGCGGGVGGHDLTGVTGAASYQRTWRGRRKRGTSSRSRPRVHYSLSTPNQMYSQFLSHTHSPSPPLSHTDATDPEQTTGAEEPANTSEAMPLVADGTSPENV